MALNNIVVPIDLSVEDIRANKVDLSKLRDELNKQMKDVVSEANESLNDLDTSNFNKALTGTFEDVQKKIARIKMLSGKLTGQLSTLGSSSPDYKAAWESYIAGTEQYMQRIEEMETNLAQIHRKSGIEIEEAYNKMLLFNRAEDEFPDLYKKYKQMQAYRNSMNTELMFQNPKAYEDIAYELNNIYQELDNIANGSTKAAQAADALIYRYKNWDGDLQMEINAYQEIVKAQKELADYKANKPNPKDYQDTVTRTEAQNLINTYQQLGLWINKAENSQEKFNQTMSQNSFTDEYTEINKDLMFMLKSLEKVQNKAREMAEVGGSTETAWERIQYRAQTLVGQISSASDEMKRLVKSGEAFRFGSDDGRASEINRTLNALRDQSHNMVSEINNLHDQNISGMKKEYAELYKNLIRLTKQADRVKASTAKMVEVGGTKRQVAGLKYDIDNTKASIMTTYNEMEKLVKSGLAFTVNKDAYKELCRLSSVIKPAVDNLNDCSEAAGKISTSMKEEPTFFEKLKSSIGESNNRLIAFIKNLRKSKNTGKSATDVIGKGLKGLWRKFLMFGLGFRSAYYLVKRLRTAFIDAIKSLSIKFSEVNGYMSDFVTMLDGLKGALATAFEPILAVILPALTVLGNKLHEVMNQFGSFWATLSGRGYIYKYTAEQKNYAASLSETASAAKEAKNQLAGFDELNILTEPSSSSSDNLLKGTWEKVEVEDDFAKRLKEYWQNEDFSGVADVLGKKISGVFTKASQIAESKLSSLSDTVAGINKSLKSLFEDPATSKNVGQAIGNMLESALLFAFTATSTFPYAQMGESLARTFNEVIAKLNAADFNLGNVLSNLIVGILEFGIHAVATTDWYALGELIGKCLASINWTEIFNGVAELVLGLFQAIVNGGAGLLAGLFPEWKKPIEDFLLWFNTEMAVLKMWWIWDVKEKFFKKSYWDDLWKKPYDSCANFWEKLVKMVHDAVKSISDTMSGLFSGIGKTESGEWNKAAAWLKQQTYLKNRTFSVPAFASGAVIPPNREFLALLGDQKHGTNIEAPLDTIVEAVREAFGTSGFGGTIVVQSVLDGKVIAESTVREINKLQRSKGVSAI